VLRAGLDEVLGGRRIEEFPRRFGAVATDVVGRTAVLLDHGSATDAVCATIAVPAIFPMMRLDGRVLVDGALTSPLPVWAARRLGADTMLAIRLRPESSQRSQPLRARVVAPIPDDGPADLELLIDTRDYSGWSARDVAALIDVGRRAAEKSLDQILDLLTPAARPGLASAGCHALPAAESQRHAAVAAGSSR